MTTRVSATQVKELINTELSDAVVAHFIETANRLVTDLLSSKGLDDDRLGDIELYLSAHFVAMRDQDEGQMTEQKVNETWAQYGGRLRTGLEFTRYGQQSMLLDTTGTLAGTVTGRRARFSVV